MAYFTGSNVIYNTSQFFVENILTAFFVVVFLLISHWMTKNKKINKPINCSKVAVKSRENVVVSEEV